jgi:hypothetical protein
VKEVKDEEQEERMKGFENEESPGPKPKKKTQVGWDGGGSMRSVLGGTKLRYRMGMGMVW